MDYLIDIHSHFLPKVDDGAKDFEASMNMLRIARDNGVGKIILTPHNKPMHHNASPSTIKQLTMQLQEKIITEGMDIQLFCGNEIYFRSDIVEMLENGKMCTMAGSSYVLIEFSPMDDYDYIRNAVYTVTTGGYQPILAHIERYVNVCSKIERVEELVRMGAYPQVNAGSIMGKYGLTTKQLTQRLFKRRLVYFVASDAHDEDKRGPQLKKCMEYISRKYGEDYAREVLYDNPMCVINGQYL